MNSLQALYPGLGLTDESDTRFSSEDFEALQDYLQPSLQKLLSQYGDSAMPDFPKSCFEDLIKHFQSEQYFQKDNEAVLANSIVAKCYYRMRPLLPVPVRSVFQRYSLRNWDKIGFPEWPIDTTADRITTFLVKLAVQKSGFGDSFIWFWPGSYRAGLVLTHDVETKVGLDNCRRVMALEEKYGFRSSFEIIPENKYIVDYGLLEEMKSRGFEVCVHGLNHDGKLFKSREVFTSRVEKIRKYAESFGAIGFRSPVMYRNIEWIQELGFEYDMSFPNVGHLDPQRGGCCTVFPFFNNNTIEIPLTTMQDYSLFNILKKHDTEIWKMQTQRIINTNGLISFIIHPDYIVSGEFFSVYERLLAYLADLNDVWHALPSELNSWWRARSKVYDLNDIQRLTDNTAYEWHPELRSIKTDGLCL